MVEIFLERDFFPPVNHDYLREAWGGAIDCFNLHRVVWRGSLLSLDGCRLVCNFRAPDAESVRIALRKGGADIRRLWTGTVHDAPSLERFTADSANVIVRRSFVQPVAVADVQAREDAAAWCLDVRHVKFVRTYFSRDRTRMLCLYHAPDAESVREAQRIAAMPMDDVWGFTALLPDT